MSRLFWRVYAALTAIALLCMVVFAVGPTIEGHVFPVRTDQRVSAVERIDDGRLCWVWESYKARARVSDNIDVFVDTPAEAGAGSSIFERETGMPWSKSRAVEPFQWHKQPYCVRLPPYVKARDPVTVRQTVYYPSGLTLFGRPLWHVALHLPEVESAGAKAP